jgi:hypothetical protein
LTAAPLDRDRITSVSERERRLSRNEALFREVNDRIERVNETLQATNETLRILCECGNSSCTEQITVPLSEYERIRSDPELFFVRKGHELPEVEYVVERHDDYDVVRKEPGEEARLARELDPRS